MRNLRLMAATAVLALAACGPADTAEPAPKAAAAPAPAPQAAAPIGQTAFADYAVAVDASAANANFAGRYAFAQEYCGGGCSIPTVTEAGTGAVIEVPVGGEDHPNPSYDYRRDSRLLRTSTWFEVGDRCVFEDLVLEDGRFRSLGKREQPGRCPETD